MDDLKAPKQYAERNPIELDRAGGYYIRHVHALTAEDLHGKSEIAAELGYRDMEIDRLKTAVAKLNNDLQRIAKFFDGVLIGDDIADKIIELLKTHVIMSEPATPAAARLVPAAASSIVRSPGCKGGRDA